jgi:hypothetical protein
MTLKRQITDMNTDTVEEGGSPWFETLRFLVGTDERMSKLSTEKRKYVLWLDD